jgi:hypothetical protein
MDKGGFASGGGLVIRLPKKDVSCEVSQQGEVINSVVGVLAKDNCRLPQLYVSIDIPVDCAAQNELRAQGLLLPGSHF